MSEAQIKIILTCGECGMDGDMPIEELSVVSESSGHEDHSHGSITFLLLCDHCDAENEFLVRDW